MDGFGTGDGQSLEAPFGHAGLRLMEWFIPTSTFREQTGDRERIDSATLGIDNALAAPSGVNRFVFTRAPRA